MPLAGQTTTYNIIVYLRKLYTLNAIQYRSTPIVFVM